MNMNIGDWIIFATTFVYFCVSLGLFHLWRKRLNSTEQDDPCDDWSKTPLPPKEKNTSTFDEIGEVVGTSTFHMAERLKIENHEDKPFWPVKEDR